MLNLSVLFWNILHILIILFGRKLMGKGFNIIISIGIKTFSLLNLELLILSSTLDRFFCI